MKESLSDASNYGLHPQWITRLLLCLVIVFAVILLKSENEKGTIALYLLASVSLTIFWPTVGSIYNFKIGPTGVELTKRVEEATAKADDASSTADSALATITRFVFNSMPRPIFDNLRKIASGFGPFDMNEGFRHQLRSLRDSGYIATNNVHIGNIPARGNDFSDFVYCTDLGRELIDRRLAVQNVTPQNGLRKS